MRVEFAPATPHSDSLLRPICSQCGVATLLVGIEAATLTVGKGPARRGYELHTFQCPRCEDFQTAVGQTPYNGVKHKIGFKRKSKRKK
jgi:hypothetical protein